MHPSYNANPEQESPESIERMRAEIAQTQQIVDLKTAFFNLQHTQENREQCITSANIFLSHFFSELFQNTPSETETRLKNLSDQVSLSPRQRAMLEYMADTYLRLKIREGLKNSTELLFTIPESIKTGGEYNSSSSELSSTNLQEVNGIERQPEEGVLGKHSPITGDVMELEFYIHAPREKEIQNDRHNKAIEQAQDAEAVLRARSQVERSSLFASLTHVIGQTGKIIRPRETNFESNQASPSLVQTAERPQRSVDSSETEDDIPPSEDHQKETESRDIHVAIRWDVARNAPLIVLITEAAKNKDDDVWNIQFFFSPNPTLFFEPAIKNSPFVSKNSPFSSDEEGAEETYFERQINSDNTIEIKKIVREHGGNNPTQIDIVETYKPVVTVPFGDSDYTAYLSDNRKYRYSSAPLRKEE